MHFPFKIIESQMSNREEFKLIDGYQPSHALFYLKKGSFVVEIDGTKEKITPGDCVILPDYMHFRRNVLNPIEFVYVKFASDMRCPYTFDMPYGKVTFKDYERFLSNISTLEKIITYDDALFASYREHLLMDILFQIYFEQNRADAPHRKRSCHDALVTAAMAYIDENLDRKILTDDICRDVGTNASSLNFKFRREFDMSVGNYIMSERMKKAIHLLVSTTYSISEIAVRCGFDNVYYFSNAFKKFNGVSPSVYRR